MDLAVGDELTIGGVCPDGVINESAPPDGLQRWVVRDLLPCGCVRLNLLPGQTRNVDFNNALGSFLFRPDSCTLRH